MGWFIAKLSTFSCQWTCSIFELWYHIFFIIKCFLFLFSLKRSTEVCFTKEKTACQLDVFMKQLVSAFIRVKEEHVTANQTQAFDLHLSQLLCLLQFFFSVVLLWKSLLYTPSDATLEMAVPFFLKISIYISVVPRLGDSYSSVLHFGGDTTVSHCFSPKLVFHMRAVQVQSMTQTTAEQHRDTSETSLSSCYHYMKHHAVIFLLLNTLLCFRDKYLTFSPLFIIRFDIIIGNRLFFLIQMTQKT